MLRTAIAGWFSGWQREHLYYMTAIIFLLILVVSAISAYYIVEALEDYDSPDLPENSQPYQAS